MLENAMYKKVNHIGIAVKDIEESLKIYRDLLGLELEGQHAVEEQKVITAFFPVGETHIELVQPTEGNVGVAKFIEKRGEGVHHLCFEVDDIEQALADLRARGAKLIDEQPREIEDGKKKMAFLHPKSTGGVLIELYQICE
ncbi:putative methylmalonyl-CoA epimerase [Candidatus Vecturithrix granuli]|uniref:Putative methylmalonyl-CoA epimerase n=1 Tax=Vecturithrix granuli TaxID=1499967 RepID=A0A081C590_VECG1|nr:putative methylmalonyl-CoA epimerase [Candidatus Vecturithrix granuli]